ncbi:globin [Methylocella silvestris BL2]|uniref:Globin n=1 Tax=Methylocella silvestris (strain DSM 15510 / CIP 108128 / LMG 27833 / NCIMB 13906 / BL2) TaxID=395965 RepID=B8EJ43_METSB|nr:group II truncated hemoglobin [Methylocella silvestris]ACK52535.1 globin [Methylocella silvestris BL2]
MVDQELQTAVRDFDLIGGAAAVDHLVESFYRNMDERPEAQAIRAIHAEDLGSTKAILKLYLGEWLGGPALYSQKRGHPRLRMRHVRFSIGPRERDAWLACMNAALDEVVAEVKLRDRLKSAFLKLADWLRNDPENAHDKHH